MLDKATRSRSDGRSALIAHELSPIDTDIAALREVHLADEGRLQELDAGFTLVWSGKLSTDRRLSNVRFMLRNSMPPN